MVTVDEVAQNELVNTALSLPQSWAVRTPVRNTSKDSNGSPPVKMIQGIPYSQTWRTQSTMSAPEVSRSRRDPIKPQWWQPTWHPSVTLTRMDGNDGFIWAT